MKRYLLKMSIRNKLIFYNLIIIIPILAISFYYIIVEDIRSFRSDLQNSSIVIAQVIADNNISALDFMDIQTAMESIQFAEKIPYISNLILFDAQEMVFATFARDSSSAYSVRYLNKDTTFFLDDHLLVYLTIKETKTKKHLGVLHLRTTLSFLNSKIQDHIEKSFILLFILISIAVVTSYKLQGIISKPILQLAEGTERISKTSDYSVRFKVPGQDEISKLFHGFNQMMAQINDRTEKLEKEIDARILTEIKLRKKADELKKSNEELDQFAYVTSHDLKAPLRAISNLATWIEEDIEEELDEETEENFKLLRGRVKRMEDLIDGILRYSRADRLRLEKEDVHLKELLETIRGDFVLNEHIRIEINAIPEHIYTERMKLFQVFQNIISNAVKYNDKKQCHIEISGFKENTMYTFSVKDNGPGIPKEYHEKVFMIFQTLEARDKIESTGIGLSIVKKIIEDFNGTIWITDNEYGGTTFHFTWEAENV